MKIKVEDLELEDLENYYNIIKFKKKNSLGDKPTNLNNNNKVNNKQSSSLEHNIKGIPNEVSTLRNNFNSNSLPFNNKNEISNKTRDSAEVNTIENTNNKKLSNTSPLDNYPNLTYNFNKNRLSLTNNSLNIHNDYVTQNNFNGDEEMEYFKKTFEFDQQTFRLSKGNRKPIEEFSKELVNLNFFLNNLETGSSRDN